MKIRAVKKEDFDDSSALNSLLFNCVYALEKNKNYLLFDKTLYEKLLQKNLATDPDFKFYIDELG